jgi:plastocyanin
VRRLVPVLVALLALTAGACTSDGATSGEQEPTAAAGTGGSGPATTGQRSPTDEAARCVDLTGGDSFTIRMRGNRFVPSCFTASAAQRLILVNEDPSLHSFTILGTPVDIELSGGETRELDAVEGHVAPGTYELICRYHQPDMSGEVTVVE